MTAAATARDDLRRARRRRRPGGAPGCAGWAWPGRPGRVPAAQRGRVPGGRASACCASVRAGLRPAAHREHEINYLARTPRRSPTWPATRSAGSTTPARRGGPQGVAVAAPRPPPRRARRRANVSSISAACSTNRSTPPRPGPWPTPIRPTPGDVAFFLLSGGTTGLPKLIPRTHEDYAYNVAASAEVCGLGPSTVYMVALPAAHNFPLGCPGLMGTLSVGGRVVMAPSPRPEDAMAVVDAERRDHHRAGAGAGDPLAGSRNAGRSGSTSPAWRCSRSAAPASSPRSPAGSARPSAARCSRSSGWPKASSTTPGSTTRRRGGRDPGPAAVPRRRDPASSAPTASRYRTANRASS